MSCESVTRSLAEGRLLGPEEEAHLTGCAACARLAGVVRTWQPAAAAGRVPRVPSAAALEGRARARGARGAAILAAAVLVFGLTPYLLHRSVAPPAAVPTVVDDLGNPVAVAEAPVAAPDVAAAPSSTDVALVGLVSSLDRLSAEREAVPGATLTDLLDPFGDDPVADPLTGNPAEGDL